MFRRIGLGVAVVVLGLGILLLILNLPFGREPSNGLAAPRIVLDYVRAVVQRDFGLVLDATRLDLNIVTFRVGLANVRLSAEGSEREPFFESEYVAASLSPRVLLGNLLLTQVSLTNVAVRVH